MASVIENYVNCTISILSQAVTQAGFGTMLFAGLTGFTNSDIVRSYANLAAVTADFPVANNSKEYQAARDAFAQSPAPTTFLIGKIPTMVAGVATITFSGPLIASNVINGSVNGVAMAPVTYATSNAATLTAITVAIAAMTGVTSCTSDGSAVLTVTATLGTLLAVSGFVVTLGSSQVTAAIAITTPSTTYSTGVAAIRAVNSTWYGLAIDDRTQTMIQEVASWAETQLIKFFPISGDAGVLTTSTTDVASVLQSKTYLNTALIYHAVTTEWLNVGWAASQLTYAAGSNTWMFKPCVGMTPDPLTTTQYTNALGKACNVFTAQSGVNMTEQGVVSSGKFIDTIVGRDWLQSTLKTDIFSLMTSLKKIPYTDKGAALIENVIRARLKNAVDVGYLAENPAPTVTMPTVASQLTADKSNRLFNNITFGATLAGAIHKTILTGTVSV